MESEYRYRSNARLSSGRQDNDGLQDRYMYDSRAQYSPAHPDFDSFYQDDRLSARGTAYGHHHHNQSPSSAGHYYEENYTAQAPVPAHDPYHRGSRFGPQSVAAPHDNADAVSHTADIRALHDDRYSVSSGDYHRDWQQGHPNSDPQSIATREVRHSVHHDGAFSPQEEDTYRYDDRYSVSPGDYGEQQGQMPTERDLHAFAAQEIHHYNQQQHEEPDEPSVVYPESLHFGQDDQTLVSNVTDLHTVEYQRVIYPTMYNVPDDHTIEDPFNTQQANDDPNRARLNSFRMEALKEDKAEDVGIQIGKPTGKQDNHVGGACNSNAVSDTAVKENAKGLAAAPPHKSNDLTKGEHSDKLELTISTGVTDNPKKGTSDRQSGDPTLDKEAQAGINQTDPEIHPLDTSFGNHLPDISEKSNGPLKKAMAIAESVNPKAGLPGAFAERGRPSSDRNLSSRALEQTPEQTPEQAIPPDDHLQLTADVKRVANPDNLSKGEDSKTFRLKWIALVILGAVVVLVAVIGGVCGSGLCGGASIEQEAARPTMAPTSQRYFEGQTAIQDYFGEDYFDAGDDNLMAARYKALDWITRDSTRPGDDNYIQRFILVLTAFQLSQTRPWLRCERGAGLCPAFNGTYLGSEWLSFTGECSWGGVSCDDSQKVLQVEMIKNDMNGQLPTELAALSQLAVLNFMDNAITGSLPTELYSMTALEELNLSANSLSGKIETEIGFMTSLARLHLSNNDFFGRIPKELSSLTGLYQLDLSLNEGLHGAIPQGLCDNVHSHMETQEVVSIKADCLAHSSNRDAVECPCCTECCDIRLTTQCIPEE